MTLLPIARRGRVQRVERAAAHAHGITSYSFAVRLGSGELVAVASGTDDHATGSNVDVHSRYPAGSVTKAYIAVSALRLAQAGKLDLDKPMAPLVDEWLAKQSKPTLTEMWGPINQANLSKVTSRMLLSMRAGMPYSGSCVLHAETRLPCQLWSSAAAA